jgi:hypothetical protein
MSDTAEPGEWVALLVTRESTAHMLVGVLEEAGLRACVRSGRGWLGPMRLSRDRGAEVLVDVDDEDEARVIATELLAPDGPMENDDTTPHGSDHSAADGPIESPDGVDEAAEDQAAEEVDPAIMGRLFDAADRLSHHPEDVRAAGAVAEAARMAARGGPPYGVSGMWWRTLQHLAANLDEVLSGQELEDEVIGAATALRTHLRDYV